MCWKYKKKSVCSINDIPKEFQDSTEVQIIYKITAKSTGQYYIGKKILYNKVKSKLSKKRKLQLKTRKTFEYKIKESNWFSYYGSSTNTIFHELLETLGPDGFEREIIMFVEGKTKAAWEEVVLLCSKEGMMHPKCLNLNVLNRFFKKTLTQ